MLRLLESNYKSVFIVLVTVFSASIESYLDLAYACYFSKYESASPELLIFLIYYWFWLIITLISCLTLVACLSNIFYFFNYTSHYVSTILSSNCYGNSINNNYNPTQSACAFCNSWSNWVCISTAILDLFYQYSLALYCPADYMMTSLAILSNVYSYLVALIL